MTRKPYPHFPFVDDYYREKIELSRERLRMFEPEEGYYLAFSGGKDSCVVRFLLETTDSEKHDGKIKFDGHYNNTSIDPPELVRFIKEYHKEVEIIKPKKPFLKELVYRGFPLRQARWCCELLKEGGGAGRLVLTGIRWAESHKRANRRMTEPCLKDGKKHYLHPIIDWDDNEVWYFIKEHNIPYCSLYDNGFKRLGCIFCPMSGKEKRIKDAEKYPRYENAFRLAFRKLYQDRKSKGLTSVDRWANGDEMLDWWLRG